MFAEKSQKLQSLLVDFIPSLLTTKIEFAQGNIYLFVKLLPLKAVGYLSYAVTKAVKESEARQILCEDFVEELS